MHARVLHVHMLFSAFLVGNLQQRTTHTCGVLIERPYRHINNNTQRWMSTCISGRMSSGRTGHWIPSSVLISSEVDITANLSCI